MKRKGNKRHKCPGIDNARLQLEMIERSDLAGLVAYARRRLLRIGLDPNLAEDITQDAFRAILIGLETTKAGRHPRESDVQDRAAFVDYLGAVINSLVAYERGKRLYRFDHEPIETETAWEDNRQPSNELRSASSVESEIGWLDLQDVFFARLRPRVHPRIQRILTDWEWEWRWSVKIPVPITQRRFRKTIRHLAKGVLAELDEAFVA